MLGKFFILVDDCIVKSDSWVGTQRLCFDEIHNSSVSTVFLGLDHVDGIFETLVEGGPIDGFMVRCDTAKQAREIHARIVSALSSVNWLIYHLDGNVQRKLLTLLSNVEDIE